MPPKDTPYKMTGKMFYDDKKICSGIQATIQDTLADFMHKEDNDKYATFTDNAGISCKIQCNELGEHLREVFAEQVKDDHTYELYRHITIRRHPKKRINKKWNKKYGVKTKEVYIGTFEASEIVISSNNLGKYELTLTKQREDKSV